MQSSKSERKAAFRDSGLAEVFLEKLSQVQKKKTKKEDKKIPLADARSV